jgi:RimJ/RimL family protein N-acetyltransferase
VKGSERTIALVAEEGASLSSGSLRLYASMPHPPLNDPNTQSLSHSATLPLIVGCIDLYNYDPLNRRAAVGIMVASDHRRQGHALAMLRALETLYSTQTIKQSSNQTIHTLYADIAATNTASLALFAKAGYTECGHFRDWLLVGDRYIDSIRMQLIL